MPIFFNDYIEHAEHFFGTCIGVSVKSLKALKADEFKYVSFHIIFLIELKNCKNA